MPSVSQVCLLFYGLLLAGCAVVGPDYQRPPQVVRQGEWQAALPHGGWSHALADWWQRFDDEALSLLLDATLTNHPALESGQGAIAAARAALISQQGGQEPQASLAGKLIRSGNSPNPTVPTLTSRSVAVDASWEIDLFGRVTRATQGAEAKVAARLADWHGLRVSLAAEVASLYNDWRGCEQVRASLAREVQSRQKTAELMDKSVAAGFTATAEGALSQAGWADARSQLIAQEASCQLIRKGLVMLSGLEEANVQAILAKGNGQLPQVVAFAVTTLPTQLLSQRPDLVAAEQELMAASAEIGVAEANLYPRLTLLGSVTAGVNSLGRVTQDNQPWSFGPALSLPFLDGNMRQANLKGAQARYDIAQASYRQSVKNAVKEVETALVNLVGSQHRREDAHAAAQGFATFFRASEENWQSGGISLLTLEEARRLTLNSQRAVMQLERQLVQHWINLYKALGGGWRQDEGEEG